MQFDFSIKSSTHYLKFLRQLIASLSQVSGNVQVDHQAVTASSLALVEAVNNAIFHAHGEDLEKWIDISLRLDQKSLKIHVVDYGEGFEMPEEMEPSIMETHGRGIFLIRSLMHDVRYSRGKKNVLEMVYYL